MMTKWKIWADHEIKSIRIKSSTQKNHPPRPNGFTGEVNDTLRDEIIPIILKLF